MEQLKKHGFWIACGLISLAMLGTWWWGTSSARTAQLGNESMIEQAAKGAKDVKTKSFDGAPPDAVVHPTAASEAGMKKQIDLATRKMIEAWELRRSSQEEILKWPEEVLQSSEFSQRFSKFDPPQKYELTKPDGTEMIPPFTDLLRIYKELIPKRMEAIASIIKTNWDFAEPVVTDTKDGKKSRPIASVATDKNLSVVVRWNEKNQELWNDKLTKFAGMDGNASPDDVPLPRQVFALQEDLWLLEALFNVIKNVNGDAQTNEMAAIKEIEHIAFGRESYQESIGKISEPNPLLLSGRILTAAGGGEESDQPRGPRNPNEDGDAGPAAGGGGGAAGPGFEFDLPESEALLGPFHGRYVNTNFEPLRIGDIHTVFKTPDLAEQNVESIVAKRIPFRVAVRMSENKIPDLIASLSNSEFAFEVFQVRLNRDDAYAPIERKGKNKEKKSGNEREKPKVGIGGGAGMGMDGGGESTSPASGSGSTEVVVSKANLEIRRKDDVDVEFYGVVKIYNPVDWSKFKALLEQSPEATAPPAAAQRNNVQPNKS